MHSSYEQNNLFNVQENRYFIFALTEMSLFHERIGDARKEIDDCGRVFSIVILNEFEQPDDRRVRKAIRLSKIHNFTAKSAPREPSKTNVMFPKSGLK